jgi:hypothetical protein
MDHHFFFRLLGCKVQSTEEKARTEAQILTGSRVDALSLMVDDGVNFSGSAIH